MSTKPVFLVVGMGPGVALGAAKRFSQAGYRIAMMARNAARLAEFEKSLSEEGVEAKGFSVDVADEAALIKAISKVQEEWGSIEVALYNAAALSKSSVVDVSTEVLISDFKVNLVGAVTMAQALLPKMKLARKGTLLFTGGGLALNPSPELLSLGIGKAAILNFTKALAKAVKKDGIRVGTVTICGFVNENGPFSPKKIADAFFKIHEQGLGEPTEIIIQS